MTSASSFRYRAADASGVVTRGRLEAADERRALDQLRSMGLHALEIRPASTFRLPTRGVSRQQLSVVFRSLASLVGAGVPFERALAATSGLVEGKLLAVLEGVRRRIHEGASVGDAFSDHPEIFPPSITGMLRAGERGSRMDTALSSVAGQLEHEAQFRSGIRSALAYPVLLAVVGVVSVVVMGGVVLPKFATLLNDLGAELPTSTRWLLAASEWTRRWGWVILATVVVIPVIWVLGGFGRRFRPAIDRGLLRVPVVGSLRHALASARVCEALGGMLMTGVPLMDALDAARHASADAEISARLGSARQRVGRGEALGVALEGESALTPVASQMIRLGDASGTVGVLARKAGEHLVEETRRTIQTLVSLFEPLLILVLGGGIALMAASLLRAVYSVRPGG